MNEGIIKELDLKSDQLYFIPLGGSEQFGVNFNLYGYNGKWLAIDCGIGFAGNRYPGIDILLPDPSFIEDRREDLVGLIVTHAHEDHVGAIPYLWPRLRCPIYCSEFTATVLQSKFEEAPECAGSQVNVIKAGETIDLDPFKASFIHISHSIPDNLSVVVDSPVGKVLHSGDWNLDATPVIGEPTDIDSFKKVGDEGVIAYVGDSTNSGVDGRSGSEGDVENGLKKVFKECKGRVAITLFSSNISRIQSIARAAEATGRSTCVMGRSLHRMVQSAKRCGMLSDIAEFIDERDISGLPDDKIVILMTGSQGEYRAMLPRIARGDHPHVKFHRGDTVIYSSRAIPGNDVEINAVKNILSSSGVNIITADDTDHTIHVSGHPCREEVNDMYQWVKPPLVVPVHGERANLEAQASFARKCQIKNVIVPNNGSVIQISGEPKIIDHVETGLLAMDANRVIDSSHPSINERRKLQYSGTIHISVVIDARGDLITDPQVTTVGLIDRDDPDEYIFEQDIMEEVEDILSDMKRRGRNNPDSIQEKIRIGVRRFSMNVLRIKPKTTVHVTVI
jgi:ribonuclease J